MREGNFAMRSALRHYCARAKGAPAGSTKVEGSSGELSRWALLKAARRAAPPPKRRGPILKVRDEATDVLSAIELIQSRAWAAFDETLEIAVRLGVDPRHANEMVRTHAILPHGHGRTCQRILLFDGVDGNVAYDDDTAVAAEFGVKGLLRGGMGLLTFIKESPKNFIRKTGLAVATSDFTSVVAERAARILAPRGLLPNVKDGTVISSGISSEGEYIEHVKRVCTGLVKIRVDRQGNLHVPLGKLSFGKEKLAENVGSVVRRILRARPAAVKKNYLKRVTLCSTMGKSVPVLIPTMIDAALVPEGLEYDDVTYDTA